MSEEKIKEFIEHKISTAPTIFWKVLDAYNKEAATEQDIIIMLTQETTLANQILKIANLPAFADRRFYPNIDAAIKILGFIRILNIAIGLAVMELFSTDKIPVVAPADGAWIETSDKLWKHSYEVAFISLATTGSMFKAHDSLAFLAGLLHDVGKQIMFDPNLYQGSLKINDLLKHEQAGFGCTHPEVGAWFAEAIGLPADVAFAIKHHHTSALEVQHTPITQIIVTAQALSKLFTSDFDVDEGKFFLFSSDHLRHLSKTVGEARLHTYNFFNGQQNHSNKLITREEADFLLSQVG